MNAARILPWLAVAILGCSVAAQDPPPTPTAPAPQQPGVTEWIEKVRRAHRPGAEDGGADALDQFRATLRLTPTRPDEDNIEVDLEASFLMPRLLRYRVQDPGSILERGQDEQGPWARTDDRILSLQGKDFAQERDAVRKHVRLARQLLSFLDPAGVLEDMDITAKPRAEKLRVSRDETMETEVLEGTIGSFPLFSPLSEDEPAPPAKLTAWLDAKSHRLVAVRVRPLDENREPRDVGEFFLLRDYKDRPEQGVMLPLRVLIHRESGGRRHPEAEVSILAIDLEPELTEEKLRRPEP